MPWRPGRSGCPSTRWEPPTGRLGVYASGKGIVSGLGEAAADRALADASWLRERLDEVEAGKPMPAIEWGRAAMARAGLYVRWTTTEVKKSALLLEGQVERLFPAGPALEPRPGTHTVQVPGLSAAVVGDSLLTTV